jgi:2-oxoglutarate ferredoxin oxidoreductase subunit alpha
MCLNQDTMDRHLQLMGPGSTVLYNGDNITPGEAADGVQMCPLPVSELSTTRNRLSQNTMAVGSAAYLLGLDFEVLEESLTLRFQRQGQSVIDENVGVARAGYDHAVANFKPFSLTVPTGPKPLAVWSGNDALAMGGAAAGVKFYAAYPMSPATGVLHWMAQNARNLGIMVRQVEDEIGVANMVIGAAHTGCRSLCATSGGGFALMTEAIGAAAMMEIPAVFIDVQRAGPSTGVPTKTEQGDLWQSLGASQGDFERFIVAPLNSLDCFNVMAELFNLTDKYQCPGIVLSDLLLSEGRFSVDPDLIDMHPKIDRGELITKSSATDGYLRYKDTESGISPRALPGLEGYVHMVVTDEHDENSSLISDEFTNPHKRRRMVEKRARKFKPAIKDIKAPELEGAADADITLVGWGSSYGVIKEAVEILAQQGVAANHLAIKWIVPFHGEEITKILSKCKQVVVVENNYSGQFYRYMRSETGLSVDGHIRKYDGEPFIPHHIVDGALAHLAEKIECYVPYQEAIT